MAVITSDDILGKEAIGPDGKVMGVVTKLHIDDRTKRTVGITVDLGMLSPDIYIGIDNVRLFGKDAIMMKRLPTSFYKGMDVFSRTGTIVGRVKDIVEKDGRLDAISILPSGSRSSSKKHWRSIAISEISEIGASMILKKDFSFLDSEASSPPSPESDEDSEDEHAQAQQR